MRYKTYLLQLLCCLLPLMTQAKDKTLDSLLQLIDRGIDRSEQYVAVRERRIDQLKKLLDASTNDAMRYDASFKLYEEYKPFINDSAIYYISRCIALATRMNHLAEVAQCRSLLALRCSNTGMYDEAIMMLDKINVNELTTPSEGVYYLARAHVYGELAYYTRIDQMRKYYGDETKKFRHLAYQALPQYDDNRFQMMETELMDDGRYDASMALNDKWLQRTQKGSHPYALVTMFRYLEYKLRNDTTQMMRWLAESVLADVRNGVMDQGSMWEMANQLLEMGEVDRAYKYICFTSDAAGRYGSRLRYAQISPLMADIAEQYKAARDRSARRLMAALAVISVMALLFLATLVYVNRQRRRLAEARDNLSKTNHKLSVLNTELSCLNNQLQSSNRQLSEANRVKEEYVGRFMRLCSDYVDQLDSFRRKLGRLLKARKMEEMNELVNSEGFKDKQLDELFANFDSAFLHLFPRFVERFNTLLKPEERILLADSRRLNTTVRIFALIRLGIEDSGKIAEFLHYSVNTIYNYRARVKNAALCDRDEFEERVKQIEG